MGVEAFMASLPPKKKKLIENIFSVGIIFTLIYAMFTFMDIATRTGDFMAWFSSSAFMPVVVLLVFLGMGYKIIKGGKLHFPEAGQQGQQKTTFNIPDTWGVRGQGINLGGKQQSRQQPTPKKPKLSIPKTQPKPKKTGTWYCSCGQLNIGNKCKNCGGLRK